MNEVATFENDLKNLDEYLKTINALSRKERIFVEEFIITNSPFKSAIRIGYSPKSAYGAAARLLKKPHIQKAIEAMRYEIQLQYDIKREYFIKHLKEIIEGKMTKPNDKISALTLLARITGHIKERPPEQKQLVILKQEGLEVKEVAIQTDLEE